MLALILKSGSSDNYFLEWFGLISLFAGLTLTEFAMPRAAVVGWRQPHPAVCILPWVIALQAVFLFAEVKPDYNTRWRDRADLAQLVDTIHRAPAPVIGDDMVAILSAGKTVLWEPSIFAELASKGVWDERPFIALIRASHFAFIVNEGYPGDNYLHDARYSPAVTQAISEAYPQTRYLAVYELHFPAGPLPPYAAGLPATPRPAFVESACRGRKGAGNAPPVGVNCSAR